ncbi:hypothetical protein AB0I51_05515 [Streptomyces sp. NPDC050549]|uniref:hypothetical protein n=1 Tax=Streptomyces sp. NPDC050549 TaxID=3155406 RepID=UPI0034455F9B
MDNTTIFGALRAFEWDPSRTRRLPSGVDLRSLMDVLEAIVLVEGFTVDNSSRDDHVNWRDLYQISRANGDFFGETSLVGGSGSVHAELLRTSARQVRRLLGTGHLVQSLEIMPSSDDLEILPPLYHDSAQFMEFTLAGVDDGFERAVARELRALVGILETQTAAVRSFALFAYRGFYYQGLACAACAPYMPHAWRSMLFSNQPIESRARFSDLVMGRVARIREAVRGQINDEFGGSAISADFPLIASYVISQCATRGALLKTAVEVRRSAKATAFRNWVHGIDRKLRDQEDLVTIKAAQDELRALVHELELELGLTKREKQQVTLTLGVPMFSAGTTTHVPRWRTRRRLRMPGRRPHLVFLRELARESTRLTPFALAFQRLAP